MKRTNVTLLSVAAVIVAAALVFSFLTFDTEQGDEPESRFDYTLVPVTEDMLEWSTPEDAMDQMDAAVSAFIAAASSEGADMAEALDALDGAVGDITRQYTVFMWDYYRDPGSYSEYYAGWTAISSTLTSAREDALREGLLGVNGDAVRELIGEEEADRILSSETPAEVAGLLTREAELVDEYYNYDGSVPYSEIILELVEVRNSIAQCYGYDDYVDYAYAEVYCRDYTPDEADEMKGAVREYIKETLYTVYYALDPDELDALYSYTEQEELFADVAPFIEGICPEFAETYDYMLEYGLIDFEYLDTKASVGYTTEEGLVYIFYSPSLDYRDVEALVHEFGHAAAMLLNADHGRSYDVMEVHSQGLEALLALDPGVVFGDGGEVYTLYFLRTMLANVTNACLIDEFEKQLYRGEVTTAEEIDELWDRLVDEYYEAEMVSSEWYDISHIFASPVYYISYGTSAFSALGIFVEGLEDPEAATETYLDAVACTDDGIVAMAEALGLASLFDEEDVVAVCEAVLAYIGAS